MGENERKLEETELIAKRDGPHGSDRRGVRLSFCKSKSIKVLDGKAWNPIEDEVR